MTPPAQLDETVRRDSSATLRAVFLYNGIMEDAVPAPGHRRGGGRRWPTAGEEAAIIATVRDALREGCDIRALRCLLLRALTMDPGRPAYPAMRTALVAGVPHVGFRCPECQEVTHAGALARQGVCVRCGAVTGEWYPQGRP